MAFQGSHEGSRERLQLLLALGLVYVVWGSTYLGIRFAVETIPPLLMAAVRFLVAGALLFVWSASRGDARPTRRQLRNSAIIGGALLLVGNGSLVIAETWISSALAALLVATVPFFVVGFDALRPGGRRPTLPVVLGLVVGFAGIALLIDPRSVSGEGTADLLGGGLILFASFAWAAGSVFARHADLPASGRMAASTHMLLGGFMLLVAAVVKGELGQLDLAAVSPASFYGLVYLIVFGSLVGFVAYSWLIQNADPTLVSTYAYVNPVIAVLLGWALGGEVITSLTLLAGGLILSAVVLITKSRGKKAGAAPRPGTPPAVLPAARRDCA